MKVIIEALSTPEIWKLPGTTAKLRIYANEDFQTSDGQWWGAGNPETDESLYLEVPCTIDANILIIPSFEIDSTVDSPTNPFATYTAILVPEGGQPTIVFLENFAIFTLKPENPSTRWDQIKILQQNVKAVFSRRTLTDTITAQIAGLVQSAVGLLRKASETDFGFVYLSDDPADPTVPIALSVTSPRIPPESAFLFASHYDTFADALVAMGNSRVRLIVSEPMTTGSATVPPTVQLEFIGNGMLTIETGETLTIQGPLISEPAKIFDNAFAGQGTVSFTGNVFIAAYYPEWWGAIGDANVANAATNVSAWNALAAAVPNESLIKKPGGAIYTVNGLISFSNKQSVTIDYGPEHASGVVPAYRWTGAGGKLLGIYDSFLMATRGLSCDLAAGATIDKFIETDRVAGFNGGHIFKGTRLNASLQANPNFIGLDLSPGSNVNNENFVIDGFQLLGSSESAALRADDGVMAVGSNVLTSATANFQVGDVGKVIRVGLAGFGGATLVSVIAQRNSATEVVLANLSGANISGARIHIGQARGTGVRNGGNSNNKHQILRNINIQQCDIGVHSRNGSVEIYNYGGGFCNIGFKSDNNTEPLIVEQMVTENNLVELEIAVGSAAVDLRDMRGSNASQLTENFYKLDGPVTFSYGNVTENNVPIGGKAIRDLGTGNLHLKLHRARFHRTGGVTISMEQTGFDTCLNEIEIEGDAQIRGVRPGPTRFRPNTFGSAGIAFSSQRLATRDAIAMSGHSVHNDTFNMATLYPTSDAIFFGGGVLGVLGLHPPATPSLQVKGTPGVTTRVFRVVARNAVGGRVVSVDPDGNHARTLQANAVLSANDFIRLTWPAQYPAPTDFQVLEVNPADPSEARIVATIAPSGGDFEQYDVIANPAGAFTTAVVPTRNETARSDFRGTTVYPLELPFAADDATPSVALGTDFFTANANPTNVTTFDDGVDGQLIRVRVNDANTTWANGAGIVTTTGANMAATNGRTYQFMRRLGTWIML